MNKLNKESHISELAIKLKEVLSDYEIPESNDKAINNIAALQANIQYLRHKYKGVISKSLLDDIGENLNNILKAI